MTPCKIHCICDVSDRDSPFPDINDELKPDWIPDLQAHYQWTQQMDPNHPAWSVLFEAPELRSYMRTFDVVNCPWIDRTCLPTPSLFLCGAATVSCRIIHLMACMHVMQIGTDPYPITAAYSVPNSSHAGQAGLVASKVELTRSQTDASRPVVRIRSLFCRTSGD